MDFSSNTPSGSRLKQMTGVAAILRFPLMGLDDIEEEVEVDSEEERMRNQEESKDDEQSQS